MQKKQKREFYSKEDLPLLYWWKVQDTGNLIFLVKGSNHSEEDHSEELIQLYGQIGDDIINKYGVDKKYLQLLKKKRKYLIDANHALAIGDEHKLWRANRNKREIDKTIKDLQDTSGRREDTLINIGKFVYGRPVNAMEITLDDFHSNLDYMNREIARQNKSQ